MLQVNERLSTGCHSLDEQAFAEVYDRHVALIYRHIFFLLSGDQAETEALTERAFLRLWETTGHTSPEKPILSLLLEIAHGLAAGHIRSQRTNGHRSEPMARNILMLSPPQQQVLLLQALDQMGNCAIAKGLGMSTRSVRLAQYEALSHLDHIIAQESDA